MRSKWAAGKARGGSISESIRDRRAKQPPAHFHRNPLGRGQLAVFSRCSLDPYGLRYGRFARALKKQPTDLRQKACYFGDRTLAGLILDLAEGNRRNVYAGGLFRTQNFDPAWSYLDDQPAIRADPCLLAAGNMDRIAAGAVDGKRVPVFGFQQVPDPINHRFMANPKTVGIQALRAHFAGPQPSPLRWRQAVSSGAIEGSPNAERIARFARIDFSFRAVPNPGSLQ